MALERYFASVFPERTPRSLTLSASCLATAPAPGLCRLPTGTSGVQRQWRGPGQWQHLRDHAYRYLTSQHYA